MVEIEFSVMEGEPGRSAPLLPILEAFKKQYNIQVKLTGIPWDRGRAEVAKFGIYGQGPDLSSIGTSWVGSLASMNALRAYTPPQVHALGGADSFFESTWRAGLLPNDPTLWAVPWLADTTVIYYWKEALAKSGVPDTSEAFSTEQNFVQTLKKLQASGHYDYPLAITTVAIPVILHEAAHWVWSAGGDFVSADNQKVAFNEPNAMQGFRNYFNLQRFISPESIGATSGATLFDKGNAAIHLAGPWLGNVGRSLRPELQDALGIAPVPGITFAGGSSFVIWQYTLHPAECFELVRFLSSQPTNIPISPHDQGLPTRRNALDMPSVKTDIFHRTYLQAMQRSRSFPSVRLWGAMEDKLIAEISNIWAELFAHPNQDLDECLHRHFDPLAQRLNTTLGN
jgi:ABC-type glycerol-3-phosphate transport system substrate-binding protein